MAPPAPSTNGNGNLHYLAPLDASQLRITRAETLKPVPEAGTYNFGDIHTDHMLVMTFNPTTGWSAPEIKPYGPLLLDPASNCLQYSTNVFEGMKAILDQDGKPCMFRPRENMARLVTSSARMALPAFDPEALLTCISKLVSLESRWIPTPAGHSLYIRPTMIGTKASIKVGASDSATLYVLVTPVGPYFTPNPANPTTGVSLLAVNEHVRSWPGGTGGYKLGLNYSPGFVPQKAAAALGYDQVLWLLGDDKLVTEAGAMNFFAVRRRPDGGFTVVTPPLDGTILPGITRDSALQLLHAHATSPSSQILAIPESQGAFIIEERPLGVPELAAWAARGELVECFGTGTAVLVVAIERIGDIVAAGGKSKKATSPADPVDADDLTVDSKGAVHVERAGKEVDVKVRDIGMSAGRGLGPVGQALWDKLLAVKEGREDFEGWNVVCE